MSSLKHPRIRPRSPDRERIRATLPCLAAVLAFGLLLPACTSGPMGSGVGPEGDGRPLATEGEDATADADTEAEERGTALPEGSGRRGEESGQALPPPEEGEAGDTEVAKETSPAGTTGEAGAAATSSAVTGESADSGDASQGGDDEAGLESGGEGEATRTETATSETAEQESEGETSQAFPVAAGEWPMWGGDPSRNMVNTVAQDVPHEWDVSSGKNIKWEAGLGSQSYGNPVISEGKILIGTNNDRERNPDIEGDKGVIMCFDADEGDFLWQMVHDKLSAGRVNDWPRQGICSTPVLQDSRFWYVSNECQVVCADMGGMKDGNDGPYKDEKYTSDIDGDILWIYDMIEELGVFPHNLATSSPLVVGDMVYVVTSNGVERDHKTIPSPRSPSFLALDKNTGEYVWESTDPGMNILHGQWSCAAYGVAGGRPQVVFPGGDGWMYSYAPESGELLWKYDCNPKDSEWKLGGLGTRNNLLATPVFHGDSVYIGVGQDPEHASGVGNLHRIRADGEGDVTDSKQVWSVGGEDFHRTMSTVAVHEGLVYAADLSGFLYCFDQQSGESYWVYDMLAAVWGSPTVIDGKVYLGDEDGDVVVCKTGKTFEKLAETNMHNSVYSTPVAANETLYITNRTTLFAIDEQ